MLGNIVITILLFASSFYLTIVLLRFLLQLARADFYNPISQFTVKATNPLLRPLRRVIPGLGGLDGASIVLAVIIQMITLYLIALAQYGGVPSSLGPIAMLAGASLNVLSLIVTIYFWSVIAVVVVSWIAPGSSHPAIQLVAQITEPVMRPVRNLMPSMGGLDLSPIIVFLILSILRQVISGLQARTGVAALLGM